MPVLNDIGLAQIEFETTLQQAIQADQQLPDSLFRFEPTTTITTTFDVGGQLYAKRYVTGAPVTGQPLDRTPRTITKMAFDVTYTLSRRERTSTNTDIEDFVMRQMPLALRRQADAVAFDMIQNTVTTNTFLTDTTNGQIGSGASGARRMSIEDLNTISGKMRSESIEEDDRYMIIHPEALTTLLNTSTNLNNNQYVRNVPQGSSSYINGARVFDMIAGFKIIQLAPFKLSASGSYNIDNMPRAVTKGGDLLDAATNKYTTYFFSGKRGFETFRMHYNPGFDKYFQVSEIPQYVGWQYFASIDRGGIAALPDSLFKLTSAA